MINKIWHLPIEPYETRYTVDWVKQFETEFLKSNINFETIFGISTTENLQVGQVLDCCGTHLYKFSQLYKLIDCINNNEVKDNDVIFFADLWFPGLESLLYIRNITKINFKICGVLHAGTWDKHDFTHLNGMSAWGTYIERGWLEGVDVIFVATQFHKNLIEDYFNEKFNKIHVTGIPFYAQKLQRYRTDKENLVVFPHRNSVEKNPDLFDKLSEDPELQKFTFIKTLDVCKTREEYFQLLGKAKYMVSFAEQETFGYSTVESMALGCHVIVPNALSYTETVPWSNWYYKYKVKDKWVNEVKKAILKAELEGTVTDYTEVLSRWSNSISNMIKILKGE